jgi:hypothetical protein
MVSLFPLLIGASDDGRAPSSGVFGPSLFGLIFGATVGTFPQAIFLVCSLSIATAIGCSLAVNVDALNKEEGKDHRISINVETERFVHSDDSGP